jgi:hypothetical protein
MRMIKIFLVMVVLSTAIPIHLYAQTPLRCNALLCQANHHDFINKKPYSLDPITLGIRQKEKGKIFLTIASSLAAGGILMLGIGALVQPDPSYYIDLQSVLLAGGTVVIGAGIGLSIPGIHLWHKGNKIIRNSNLNH